MKDYKVGQIFEVIDGEDGGWEVGSIVVLAEERPKLGYSQCIFDLVKGSCAYNYGINTKKGAYTPFSDVKRIYPPESDKVSITCEGKTVEISRESAKALNLI